MSHFQDKQLTCVDCGGTFLWSAYDQAYYREKGYAEPKRCDRCREAKKERLASERKRGKN